LQAVKPTPVKGGGAEAASIEGITCELEDFCSAALEGSETSGPYSVKHIRIIAIHYPKRKYLNTSALVPSSMEAGKVSSAKVYQQQQAQYRQQ
jgi:hypothetical protein